MVTWRRGETRRREIDAAVMETVCCDLHSLKDDTDTRHLLKNDLIQGHTVC